MEVDWVCDSDWALNIMGWLRGRDWGHPQAQLTLFMDHVFWVLHGNGMHPIFTSTFWQTLFELQAPYCSWALLITQKWMVKQ